MVEQIIGELVEDVIGVEVESGLRAVPARVGEVGRLGLHPQTETPALAQSHAPTLSRRSGLNRCGPVRELAAHNAQYSPTAANSAKTATPAANWQQHARIPSTTLPIQRTRPTPPRTGSKMHAYRAQRCQFNEPGQPRRELAATCTHTEPQRCHSTNPANPAANWQQHARIPSTTLPIPPKIRHARQGQPGSEG